MAIRKLITMIMCGLILLYSIDCNKTNEKSIVSNENIYESKNNSEKQSNDENNETEEYKIRLNLIFYVLEEEYLENNDPDNPNVSILIRKFKCYDGVKNSIYPHIRTMALEKVNTIEEFRSKLIEYPSDLELPPNTIVSSKLLDEWKSQDYDGLSSY